MPIFLGCRMVAKPSLSLEKARAFLLALQPTTADLVLMIGLEVLLWTA